MSLLAAFVFAAAPAVTVPPGGVSLRATASVEILRSERASDPASPERVERRVKRDARVVLVEFS